MIDRRETKYHSDDNGRLRNEAEMQRAASQTLRIRDIALSSVFTVLWVRELLCAVRCTSPISVGSLVEKTLCTRMNMEMA